MVRVRRSSRRRALGRAAQRESAPPLDLSLGEVVDAVEQAPATVGDVAVRLGIDPSRASRLTARAVRAGLLVRAASQADGRRIELELTDAGRCVARQMHSFRRRSFAAAMSDWTERERREFARLLTRFIDSLESVDRPQ